MTRLSNVLGQPALNLIDASEAGKAVAVQVESGRITAIELDGGARIAASSIRTFEGEALTFDGSPTSEPLADGAARPSKVRGMRALTEGGLELGSIDDLELSGDGTITCVMLDNGAQLAGSRLRVVGSYAAIIADEADSAPE